MENIVQSIGQAEEAEKEFSKENFLKAVILYTELIIKSGDILNFVKKRSECLMRLDQFELALEDIQIALELDENDRNVHMNAIECNLRLGKISDIDGFISKLNAIFPDNSIDNKILIRLEKLKNLFAKIDESFTLGCFSQCLNEIDAALLIAEDSSNLKLMKVQCLIILDENKTFVRARFAYKKHFNTSLQEKFFNAMTSYYNEEFWLTSKIDENLDAVEEDFKMFERFQWLKKKSSVISGYLTGASELLKRKNFDEALDLLKIVLAVDPFNKKVKSYTRLQIAKASMGKADYDESIKSIELILAKEPHCFEALKMRAKCHFELKLFEKSENDCNEIMKHEFVDRETTKIINEIRYKIEEHKKSNENVKQGSGIELNEAKPKYEIFSKLTDEEISSNNKTSKQGSSNKTKSSSNQPKGPGFHFKFESDESSEENISDKESNQGKINEEAKMTSKLSSILKTASDFLSNEDYTHAIDEALKAIEIDKNAFQGYSIAMESYLKLGESETAEKLLKKFDGNSSSEFLRRLLPVEKIETLKTFDERIKTSLKTECYAECLSQIEEALKIATKCDKYTGSKVECLIRTERYKEAEEIIDKKLQEKSQMAEMYFLRGLHFYLKCVNFEESIECFEKALITDPYFKKAQDLREKVKKIQNLYDSAIDIYNQKNYKESISKASELLTIDRTNQSILFKAFWIRGNSKFQLLSLKEALLDFTEALKINPSNLSTLKARAETHFKLNEFEYCIIDCEEILKLQKENPSNNEEYVKEVTKLMKNAQEKMKSVKPVSDFEILGISQTASQDEILQAFRKKTLEFFSDKHPTATAVDKRKLDRKYISIRDAYERIKAGKGKIYSDNSDQKQEQKDNRSSNQKEAPKTEEKFKQKSQQESYQNFYQSSNRKETPKTEEMFKDNSQQESYGSFPFNNRSDSSSQFYTSASQSSFNIPDFSSFGGCQGMVREGFGFRKCKNTVNCPHHRESNRPSNSISSDYFSGSSSNSSFNLFSNMSQYQSPSRSSSSSSSGRCTASVYDRSTKSMRQCRNSSNCPHH